MKTAIPAEDKEGRVISAYTIKLIAAVSMLIDHAGAILLYTHHESASLYWVMRSLGRIAFPLYAMLAAEGLKHTKSRKNYFGRLTLFAAVSQLPYSLALAKENYAVSDCVTEISFSSSKFFFAALFVSIILFVIFFREKKYFRTAGLTLLAYMLSGLTLRIKGITLFREQLNVIYTLAASLALIHCLELWKERKLPLKKLTAASLICLVLCLEILGRSDYGFNGAVLILLLYIFRGNRARLCIFFVLWCLYRYFPDKSGAWYLFAGALTAEVPMLLYSGKQGKRTRLFYLVYPLHLLVYAAVGLLLLA